MSISYPLAFPTHKNPRAVTFRPRKVVGVATAPGSLVQQTYEWPGERWEAELVFAPMGRADAEAWMGWLTSLRGAVGSFLLGDPAAATPRGTATTGTASGAAGARTLTSSGSGTLKAGDWVQLTEASVQRIHKVLADATVGSSIEIWPALRAAVSGATMTLTNPRGQFMLSSAPEMQSVMGGMFQVASVSAVEDLRA